MDLTAKVSEIRNPTLVLCGSLDQTTPPALARELAQKISGAHYEEIPDSGHCPMLEQAGLLTGRMKAFLS
jgi:pimeloyl-ACP methyl ester carboxylesterase